MKELKTLKDIFEGLDENWISKKTLKEEACKMKELKTLKDIRGGIDEYYGIFYKNLREEAIKWVKKEVFCSLCEDDFKEFFNITEKDLEEKNKNDK